MINVTIWRNGSISIFAPFTPSKPAITTCRNKYRFGDAVVKPSIMWTYTACVLVCALQVSVADVSQESGMVYTSNIYYMALIIFCFCHSFLSLLRYRYWIKNILDLLDNSGIIDINSKNNKKLIANDLIFFQILNGERNILVLQWFVFIYFLYL